MLTTAAKSAEEAPFAAAPRSPFTYILSAVGARVRPAVRAALVGAFVLVGLSFLLQKEYASESSFIPDAGQGIGGALGGLVGQFVGAQAGALSPRLAGDLVTSEPVLLGIVQERFPAGGEPGATVRLVDVLTPPSMLARMLGSERDTGRVTVEAAGELKKRVAVDVNERTGLVKVAVTLPDPLLAATVANRLIDRVDSLNSQSARTRAGATRRFLSDRMEQATVALRRAEAALQQFYTDNRIFQSSPRLRFDEARLQREVELRQQVFTTLNQQLEQARIDEVRDTPVLSRVQVARPPYRKASPRRSLFAVAGAVVGAGLVVLFAAIQGYLSWYGQYDPRGHEMLHSSLAAFRRR